MANKITDARPQQVRVADEIRQRIERGEYAPGQRLPTLEEMRGEFGCGQAVVRRAVDLLRQQGLIVSRQGLGSFVRRPVKARRHSISRYARHIWAEQGTSILTAEAASQGTTADQIIRELAEVPAPPRVADHLEIPPGTPVWVRRRTTRWGDRLYQLADSYYPLDIAEAAPAITGEDTGPGGGYARIEEAGVRLAEVEEYWSARMPTGPEVSELQLPGITPVVELVRVTYTDTVRPIEVMLATIAGDLVSFHTRAPIPD